MQIFAQTERLILREVLEQDAPFFFELDSDPEVHKYLGNYPVQSIEECEAIIQHIRRQYRQNGIGRWAVIDKATGAFIGWSGLKYEQSIRPTPYYGQRVDYTILETHVDPGFQRHLIQYTGNEGDEIRAYLFIPTGVSVIGSLLVHHQHNAERHLGKSEVAGLVGDPFQFFCPVLAKRGIITLAPDSICFEDRRTNTSGIEPAADPDDDGLQHYNELCYRLLRGTTLMKKVIEDSAIAISLLEQLEATPENRIGILGHSYGGNIVL